MITSILGTDLISNSRTTINGNFNELAPTIDPWTDWTPTFLNFTPGSATIIAKYKQFGNTVNFSLSIVWANNTSITSGFMFTGLPTSIYAPELLTPIGNAIFIDDSTGIRYMGYINAESALFYYGVSGATITSNVINATAPFTFTTSDKILLQGSYQSS